MVGEVLDAPDADRIAPLGRVGRHRDAHGFKVFLALLRGDHFSGRVVAVSAAATPLLRYRGVDESEGGAGAGGQQHGAMGHCFPPLGDYAVCCFSTLHPLVGGAFALADRAVWARCNVVTMCARAWQAAWEGPVRRRN